MFAVYRILISNGYKWLKASSLWTLRLCLSHLVISFFYFVSFAICGIYVKTVNEMHSHNKTSVVVGWVVFTIIFSTDEKTLLCGIAA